MFKRALQVKMVKTEKFETPKVPSTDPWFERKVATVGHHLKNLVVLTGAVVVAYVAADTVRQVAINKTEK